MIDLCEDCGPTYSAYTDHWFIDQSVSDSRRTLRVKRRTSNNGQDA